MRGSDSLKRPLRVEPELRSKSANQSLDEAGLQEENEIGILCGSGHAVEAARERPDDHAGDAHRAKRINHGDRGLFAGHDSFSGRRQSASRWETTSCTCSSERPGNSSRTPSAMTRHARSKSRGPATTACPPGASPAPPVPCRVRSPRSIHRSAASVPCLRVYPDLSLGVNEGSRMSVALRPSEADSIQLVWMVNSVES